MEDKTVYKDIKLKEIILLDLMDKSNRILKFYTCKSFTEKEVKYFSYDFKKTSNLDKFYLLPKIHEHLFNVPGRPGISSCETPKQKASEFLDFRLKPLMQSGWSYVLYSGDFIYKMKRLGKVPEDSFLVTTDAVGLYPSIPHKGGFSIKKQIRATNPFEIPTNDLVKLAEFPPKSIFFFEFDNKINRSLALLLGLTLVLHMPVFI